MINLLFPPQGEEAKNCLFGQLNHTAEIKANVEHLKILKANFENKARYLISLYVKEKLLVDQFIEGLQKAGLAVE